MTRDVWESPFCHDVCVRSRMLKEYGLLVMSAGFCCGVARMNGYGMKDEYTHCGPQAMYVISCTL
jgi:hypothetical protein